MYKKIDSVFSAGITIFLMVVIATIGALWFYQKQESFGQEDHLHLQPSGSHSVLSQPEGYSSFNSFDSGIYNGFPYARLQPYVRPNVDRSVAAQRVGSYNTQLFSPTIAKKCAGGPYMYTSNPYLQVICQGISNDELAQVACGKAFHGRPVHFDYTSISDDAWDNNALCNTPLSSSLCVL